MGAPTSSNRCFCPSPYSYGRKPATRSSQSLWSVVQRHRKRLRLPLATKSQRRFFRDFKRRFKTHTTSASSRCVLRNEFGRPIGPTHGRLKSPANNTNTVALQRVPKIAVYSPDGAQPWDDAVTMVLEYADIPFTTIYDTEVLDGSLGDYQWLHLHHEDFTGQYGKFYGSYRDAAWYINQKASFEAAAHDMGFDKVSQQKLAVAKTISTFVDNGGFLFAMCSATDSYDIALAAQKTDICESMFDGDPMAPGAAYQLDYAPCFAFKDFTLETNPLRYEYSNIDITDRRVRSMKKDNDYFELFDFSAKYDVIPTILVQNHTDLVKSFYGQTTAFLPKTLKPTTTILGSNAVDGAARYIHGTQGKGYWTFFGGHDPEDYQHRVGDPHTDLNNHPNSPGYRLILNNILFPAAKKPPQKT